MPDTPTQIRMRRDRLTADYLSEPGAQEALKDTIRVMNRLAAMAGELAKVQQHETDDGEFGRIERLLLDAASVQDAAFRAAHPLMAEVA